MNSSKITLKKLLYEHNTEANALLRASYSELETAITRYLNFIEDSPLIKDFIEDAVANHTPEGFDASTVVRSVSINVYSKFGPFPPDYKGETAVVYLLLHALVEEHACNRDCCSWAIRMVQKVSTIGLRTFWRMLQGVLFRGLFVCSRWKELKWG